MAKKDLSHVKLIKCVEIAHFFFLCYVKTVYLEDLKLASFAHRMVSVDLEISPVHSNEKSAKWFT